ncbi:MAG: nitrous oxide reductase accessory protein NosL [Bacteroidia bacterium]|jgi:copper chaperone NosL|nr:nitrous oxide reductase accessory protein NosL [Bacteroidia bacterium]
MKISKLSKVLAFVCALVLFISLFVPLWRIELDAPQYPEGLALLIYPNAIKGDVDIINGLNHYIGMQTLHAEKFIEFTLLPYIIGLYALLMLLIAILGKRKLLNGVTIAFVLFGIVAMVDFWRWEYNYGHNLDPDAAIKVPGMTYQPPLIGFKQLLNFGAYSIPDIGGWLFIVCGILLIIAVTIENNWLSKMKKQNVTAIIFCASMLIISSCGQKGPVPIQLNKDECAHCKMTITDLKFATEIITDKNRIYKFDDIVCTWTYLKENETQSKYSVWISDYLNPQTMVNSIDMHFVKSDAIKSPMGGKTIAFENKDSALKYATSYQSELLRWENLNY